MKNLSSFILQQSLKYKTWETRFKKTPDKRIPSLNEFYRKKGLDRYEN